MARNDLVQRALLDAALRYDPQIGALKGLRSQRAQEYTRRRRVLASNARGITAAIDTARPDVERAFDDALATVGAHRSALGAQDAPQAAAFQRRVGESRSNALSDLLAQRVRAEEGRVFGAEQARDEYRSDRSRIEGQMQDLLGQRGMYAASRRGELAEARAGRSVTRRGQTLSSRDRRASLAETQRHNREQEATARQRAANAARGRGPGGVKWATPKDHAAFRDQVEQARALITQQRKRGVRSRAELIRLLTTGRESRKVEVDGQEVTLPAIPRLPADAVRAAANLTFDKSLSRGDLKRLHARGLQIRRLRYPLRRPQAPRGPGGAVGLAVNPRGAAGISSRMPR